MELTRKKLVELANSLDAVRVATNIYDYLNVCSSSSFGNTDPAIKNVIEMCKKIYPSATHYYSTKEVAFSHGMYGNTGRIDNVMAIDENNNWLGVVGYIYY